MSRTYKDQPNRVRFPEYSIDMYSREEPYEYSYICPHTGREKTITRYVWLKVAGILPKKRKKVITDWHWLKSTPSLWTRIMMNRPQRRRGRLWETNVVRQSIDSLEDELPPDVSHKPHEYYW